MTPDVLFALAVLAALATGCIAVVRRWPRADE